MSIEKAIINLITSNEAINALIVGRLYPVYLPQGAALPAIAYQLIDAPQQTTTDGPLGLTDATYQFNCFAATHAALIELTEAMILLLANYHGVIEGVTIQGTQIIGRRDIPALDDQAEQSSRYGRLIECTISFNES